MLRIVIRHLSTKPPNSDIAKKTAPASSTLLTSIYKHTNKSFPKLLPRLVRFTWSDLVIYSEVFFIGLMVYIHFIDP
ncbi:unnamed protein product [Blepharisma stoltei]|uniref:Succinate dehydrogenase subunit 4 n=1 Tax=Blepharisma stoltei TaxID=1481888 RepID=A0AAU9IAB0_9CILI|nr:unnamed protein product [Blepharisma stoltei]